MKKNIRDFLTQIIPIVVGILVALYINNWNETRKDKKYIKQISASIEQELLETKADIIATIPKQKAFVDTLAVYANDPSKSLLDITMKAKGIYVPTIRINAWTAFSNSKIELMDYEKISALTEITESKEILNRKAQKLGDFLYDNNEEKGANKKQFLKILMLELIGTEQDLLERVESVENTYK